jgi:hypothetical protein
VAQKYVQAANHKGIVNGTIVRKVVDSSRGHSQHPVGSTGRAIHVNPKRGTFDVAYEKGGRANECRPDHFEAILGGVST